MVHWLGFTFYSGSAVGGRGHTKKPGMRGVRRHCPTTTATATTATATTATATTTTAATTTNMLQRNNKNNILGAI